MTKITLKNVFDHKIVFFFWTLNAPKFEKHVQERIKSKVMQKKKNSRNSENTWRIFAKWFNEKRIDNHFDSVIEVL